MFLCALRVPPLIVCVRMPVCVYAKWDGVRYFLVVAAVASFIQ